MTMKRSLFKSIFEETSELHLNFQIGNVTPKKGHRCLMTCNIFNATKCSSCGNIKVLNKKTHLNTPSKMSSEPITSPINPNKDLTEYLASAFVFTVFSCLAISSILVKCGEQKKGNAMKLKRCFLN